MPEMANQAQHSFEQDLGHQMPLNTDSIAPPRASNQGGGSNVPQRLPKCVGCIHDEMQQTWLDTLMSISEYPKIFGLPIQVAGHQPLLTRRWILAEHQGRDLVEYTKGLQIHDGSHTCLEISKFAGMQFNNMALPRPHEYTEQDSSQVECTDYFGPYAAPIQSDASSQEEDSEISLDSISITSSMSMDDIENSESPEALDSWENLANHENTEEDVVFDFSEVERFLGSDIDWSQIETPITPSVFLPPPEDPSWTSFNIAPNGPSGSSLDVSRKRSFTVADPRQDGNSIEKRIRIGHQDSSSEKSFA